MFSKRKFKDTGYLVIKNSSLAVGSQEVLLLDLRFEPYNDMKVVNLSDEDLEITVNQHSVQICPRGSEIQINQEIIKDIRIKNIGTATINANEIRVFYRNDGFEGREIINKTKTIGSFLLWVMK